MKKWGAHAGKLPSLNHLVALESTGRLGSFRAAAEEMCVTQGAVAQQVRNVESELGHQLFDRLPRGLSPNEKGREYIDRLRLALGIIEEATKEFSNKETKNNINQVTLSTTPSFASRWLISRLPRLNEIHPSISLMIDASNSVRSLRGEDSVDMAIRWASPPFSEGHARFLLPGRAIPVCSPEFLAGKEKFLPDELQDLPLISDSHNNWKNWFEAYGDPGTKFSGPTFSQSSHALKAAEEGMGVALVSGFLVESAVKDGTLVHALGDQYQLDTQSAFYIVTAEPCSADSIEGKVIEWLLDEVSLNE